MKRILKSAIYLFASVSIIIRAVVNSATAQIPEHIEVTDQEDTISLWESPAYIILFIVFMALIIMIYKWTRDRRYKGNSSGRGK